MRQASAPFLTFVTLWLTATAAMAAVSTDPKTAPAGTYKLDPTHTSIIFYVDHLGFSPFAGRFDAIGGQLIYDPAKPEASSLAIEIDPASVNTNSKELDEKLAKPDAFNVEQFTSLTFTATKIEVTGDKTGKITGDFTMLGVSKPVTLDVTFVGHGEHPFSKAHTLGFTAKGKLTRSDFGFKNWLPMVGDEVSFQISAEFGIQPKP